MLRDRILATIDAERLAEIRARWSTPHPDDRREKYLDVGLWIDVNLRRVALAGLHHGYRRRVLDLGCGCGYFLYICKLFGHQVEGIDRPEPDSMYTDMRRLLGVPCIGHEIRAFEPLPELGHFDVVTAHMVCFNGHNSSALWGPAEWQWLLEAIPARTWSIELNAERDGTLYPGGLRGYFELLGAQIAGHRVLIRRA